MIYIVDSKYVTIYRVCYVFVTSMKYNIIYADSPWAYRNTRTGGSLTSGSAQQYSTLSIQQLCDLPILPICEKNSVLFLWATVPLLPEALQVMNAWGFKYKTMITWRKIMSLGMGYWFRGQCEHLLFGVKGKVKAFRMQVPNFVQLKALKHSQKPEEFRQLIDQATMNMIPQMKLEVFARQKECVSTVNNWTYIGYDIDGKDIHDSLQELCEK